MTSLILRQMSSWACPGLDEALAGRLGLLAVNCGDLGITRAAWVWSDKAPSNEFSLKANRAISKKPVGKANRAIK